MLIAGAAHEGGVSPVRAGDPNAHRGNVMREQESRAWRSAIEGMSQIGPCRACRNSGDAR
eukprot:2765966-Pleurochrysis_carterae.AAC.1